jgi:hypothetical protein
MHSRRVAKVTLIGIASKRGVAILQLVMGIVCEEMPGYPVWRPQPQGYLQDLLP